MTASEEGEKSLQGSKSSGRGALASEHWGEMTVRSSDLKRGWSETRASSSQHTHFPSS